MSAETVGNATNTKVAGRTREGERITWIGVFVNVFLMGIKIAGGIISNSQALIADGVHSLSDLFSDFVVLVGYRWSRKEADHDHPYGHARIDTISSMVVGGLLLLVGGGIAYTAIISIYDHDISKPSLLAIYAAAASVVLKEVLFWYTLAVGKRLRSAVIVANAWHHRSDALSSVAVLLGVGAVYANPEWQLADPLAAIVVTFFVARVGINLVWTAFRELSDVSPDSDTMARISHAATAVSGVRQVHDIKARFSGPHILVELDIVVKPDLTVREGHDIAIEVKSSLLDLPDISHVKIHVDPEPKPADTL